MGKMPRQRVIGGRPLGEPILRSLVALYDCANLISTFAVIRETGSSTSSELIQLIEPVEKTAPPLGGSWTTMWAPPSPGFRPRARRCVLAGESGDILSVS